MALPFGDNFNRADGGLGANWATVLGNPAVVSNQASASSGVTESSALIFSETFSNDQKISALIVAPVGTQNSGLMLQGDGTRQYLLVFNNADTKMYRLVGTGYTQLGAAFSAVSAGQTAEFRVVSDTLTFWINGVQDGTSRAGGGSYTNGNPGIWFFGTGSFLDDVSADNVGGAAVVYHRRGLLGVGR